MGLKLTRLGESIAKASPEQFALAERLALQFEEPIAKAVLAYLQASADLLNLDTLIAALESGQADRVLAVVDAAADAAQAAMAGKVVDALQDAVWAAGAAALAAPGTPPMLSGRAEFHFDRLNPVLVEWLKQYELGLIRQITSVTREAIRDTLVTNMLAGKGPAAQSVAIKEAVGLTARQSAAVANFRKELETFHSKRTAARWGLGKPIDRVNGKQVFKPDAEGLPKDGILERRLRDFRYDGMLEKAMATGKPLKPEQIDKMVAAYTRKYRRYRALTISRTESLRATNVGVQEAFRQAVETGVFSENLVRRKWVVAKDERTCAVCNSVAGLNPKLGVRLAQPFATAIGPVMLPPLHPSCRCTLFCYTIEPGQDAP